MLSRFVRNPVLNMYTLSAVVFGGPGLCKRGVHKRFFFCKSQLCSGCASLLPAPGGSACFPCVFFSVVFALRRWAASGLVSATKLCKSTEIAHTSWRISIVFFVYNVLTLLWGTPLLPQFTLVHPPRASLRHTQCSPVLTGPPTAGHLLAYINFILRL